MDSISLIFALSYLLKHRAIHNPEVIVSVNDEKYRIVNCYHNFEGDKEIIYMEVTKDEKE